MRTLLAWHSPDGEADGRPWRVLLGGVEHDVSEIDTRGCSARCVLRPRAAMSLRTRHDRRWVIDGGKARQAPVAPEETVGIHPPPARGTHAWLRARTEAALNALVAARSHATRCPSREAWRAVAARVIEARRSIQSAAEELREDEKIALVGGDAMILVRDEWIARAEEMGACERALDWLRAERGKDPPPRGLQAIGGGGLIYELTARILRQESFMRRISGAPPPWTDDPVLAAHRFTNVYRASDRVSQYLIRHVIYEGAQAPEEVFFRTILFKLFNKIETWENLSRKLGAVSWGHFSFDAYATALDGLLDNGERIYSAAYIMPSPAFGSPRKHRNHLRLIEHMMRDGAPRRIGRARSLREVFEIMRGYPSLGDFLAFQFTIDLNYSELVDFSEMDFVVAGPGARDGIRKCFSDTGGRGDAEIIRMVTERAAAEFDRLGLQFRDLWGRPLQLIDCQNLFCEVDKYARVVHPDIRGRSGRERIKQRFTARQEPLPQWYPPKWQLRVPSTLHYEARLSMRGR